MLSAYDGGGALVIGGEEDSSQTKQPMVCHIRDQILSLEEDGSRRTKAIA